MNAAVGAGTGADAIDMKERSFGGAPIGPRSSGLESKDHVLIQFNF